VPSFCFRVEQQGSEHVSFNEKVGASLRKRKKFGVEEIQIRAKTFRKTTLVYHRLSYKEVADDCNGNFNQPTGVRI